MCVTLWHLWRETTIRFYASKDKKKGEILPVVQSSINTQIWQNLSFDAKELGHWHRVAIPQNT